MTTSNQRSKLASPSISMAYLWQISQQGWHQKSSDRGAQPSNREARMTITFFFMCHFAKLRYVGRWLYLMWLAHESLRDLFPAGATDVLPSVRRSYPPQLPDYPHVALVDPG